MEFTSNMDSTPTIDSTERVTESLKDAAKWLIGERPGIDAEDISELLGVSAVRALENIDSLLAEGRIEFVDSSRLLAVPARWLGN